MKECGLSPPRAKKTSKLARAATFTMIGKMMNDISVTLISQVVINNN